MLKKLYAEFKKFIKENYLTFLFYLVFICVMLYPLPYYIYTGGGIINVEDKIEVDTNDETSGSLNMCYVSEINATLPTYILSYILPGWDLVSKEEIVLSNKEDDEDVLIRDKIYLSVANQSAILTAYNYANKDYEIINKHHYVIYIDEDSNTDLEIGDEILLIDGKIFSSIEDISYILDEKNVGDKVELKVKSNDKELIKYAIIRKVDDRKIIGLSFSTIYDYETNPKVKFNFSESESGPSGGLMLSLALYNKLVDYDITNGLKISGTGTIEEDGSVGEIGGVKYKLKGAVKEKSDIFLVPNGDNYDEAIKLKKEYNYDIKIIGVDSFADALNKLNFDM